MEAQGQGVVDAAGDMTVSDASTPDAGAPYGTLIVVNGSPNAPALRFCFGAGDPTAGTGTQVPAVPAAPDDDLAAALAGMPYPGLFPGFGGPAPAPPTDWSLAAVAVYAIDATTIRAEVRSKGATEANCDALLGAGGGGGTLSANQDYWYLGSIPKGTLAAGTSWLSAIVGCVPGGNADAAGCELATDASASLGSLWELDNSTALDAGSFGAQFANASYALAMNPSALQGASANLYVPGGADAGSTGVGPLAGSAVIPVAADAAAGALVPASLLAVSGVTFDDASGFFFSALAPDGGAVLIADSLPTIERRSWGVNGPEGGAFADGRGYVFILVGDPSLPGRAATDAGDAAGPEGGYTNPRAGHILAFPTDLSH